MYTVLMKNKSLKFIQSYTSLFHPLGIISNYVHSIWIKSQEKKTSFHITKHGGWSLDLLELNLIINDEIFDAISQVHLHFSTERCFSCLSKYKFVFE